MDLTSLFTDIHCRASQIIADSPLLPELVHIIKDAPESGLAGAAMGVLAVLALMPDGRQAVSNSGAAAPLVRQVFFLSDKIIASSSLPLTAQHPDLCRLITNTPFSHANVDKAITLLMNLSADQSSRRVVSH